LRKCGLLVAKSFEKLIAYKPSHSLKECSFQMRAFEMRTVDLGSFKDSFPKDGPSEPRSFEVRSIEPRSFEIRFQEKRSLQVRIKEGGAFKMRF
jgi:hypothetical protein